MKPLSELTQLLKTNQRIAIIGHARPDGDAIGSSLGLYHYLKSQGHEARVVVPNGYAEFLKWLPGEDTIVDYQKEGAAGALILDSADIIFCLDFNDPARVENMTRKLVASEAVKVMIDHHRDPKEFTDYRFWDDSASSTAELIWRFLEELGESDKVTYDTAVNLYTGMMTDTGCFRYSNTSPRTLEIASKLLAFKLDVETMYSRIYHTFTEDRLRFFGHCLTNKMQIFPEYHTGVIHVSRQELTDFNVRTGYTEGLVNYPLSIEGIRFSTLIIDRTSQIKLSFRSKGEYNVEQFASAHFEGGGHRNASGGSSHLDLEQTLAKFISLLPEQEGLK